MVKVFGAMTLVLGLALGAAFGADSQPAASAPATTAASASAPACCGATCLKMTGCCKADATGTVKCAMGGGCCVKK